MEQIEERVIFDEYRFHFKPKNNNQLYIDYNENKENTFERKNEILKTILESEFEVVYKNKILKYLINNLGDNLYHIRLANEKTTKIEKDFKSELLTHNPSCNIFIYNDNYEQKIFIESDKSSFSESKVVADLLSKTFNNYLNNYGLNIELRLEFEEGEFWDLIKKYEGQITSIAFTLIYPNLPAAHKDLNEDLKDFTRLINSDRTVLEFRAQKNETLTNINETNTQIEKLNSATSIQGSPTIIKTKKKKYKTGKQKKSVNIEKTSIETNDIKVIELFAKKLFKK